AVTQDICGRLRWIVALDSVSHTARRVRARRGRNSAPTRWRAGRVFRLRRSSLAEAPSPPEWRPEAALLPVISVCLGASWPLFFPCRVFFRRAGRGAGGPGLW